MNLFVFLNKFQGFQHFALRIHSLHYLEEEKFALMQKSIWIGASSNKLLTNSESMRRNVCEYGLFAQKGVRPQLGKTPWDLQILQQK